MDYNEFLEQDAVKNLIAQNNLETVYELLPETYRPEFTNYLREKGVDALTYLESYIPKRAFDTIATLPSTIHINDSVTHIMKEAFFNNDWIETVVLPKSLIEVAQNAFAYCSNLHTFIYPGTIEELRAVTFKKFWFNWGMPTVKCLDDICTISISGEVKDKSFI